MNQWWERFGQWVRRIRWKSVLPIALPLGLLAIPLWRGAVGPDIPEYEAPDRPPPAPTVPTTVTVLVPLPRADGTTTVPPVAAVGAATMSGTVAGPTGPVAGATVRLERFANGGTSSVDVATAADGSWRATGLSGGRYRVRAFLPPTLAQLDPELLFLAADGEEDDVDLRVEGFGGSDMLASVAPDPPSTGQAVTVAVLLTTRAVDGAGYVRAAPLAGWSVQLLGTGSWQALPPTTKVTDGSGQTSFLLICQTAGPNRISVSARAAPADPPTVLSAAVPDCVQSAAPTTASSSSTTSTTR